MFTESEDEEQIIERVAALDIGKAELVCCVRMPAPPGKKRRLQEVTTHTTMVGSLSELANRLVGLGVQRVVMEATSDYWRAPFYLFAAHGLDPWLVNAKDVHHCPAGRRPIGWMRCGCARSPNARCCGPVSFPRPGSAGCGT